MLVYKEIENPSYSTSLARIEAQYWFSGLAAKLRCIRMPSNKKRAAVRQRMPAKNRNGLPAYQRIQSAIRKRIDTGQLHPGDAVASERDLAKIHQVSLMTARHALASLEREGIVERRRGIGTFVSAPKIHFNKLMSYTEQMSSRSLTAG